MEFYSKQFGEARNGQKSLVSSVSRLLQRKSEILYPLCSSDSILAKEFAVYFKTNIHNIRNEVETIELLPADYSGIDIGSGLYCELIELSSATTEVVRIVRKCATKSCNLDPVPFSVFLKHLDLFFPVITNIVDLTLESSTMPSSLKKAVLNILLKRSSLDHELY